MKITYIYLILLLLMIGCCFVGCEPMDVPRAAIGTEDPEDIPMHNEQYFKDNPYDEGERADSPLKILLPADEVARVTVATTARFKGWGGTRPYMWAVEGLDGTGTIGHNGDKEATYLASTRGYVTVILTDAASNVTTKTVINEPVK
jgi:hypothetical protein